ncbi:MAG: hypothetical protein WCG21_09295 [Eubacteriales bacterium]
MTTFVFARVDDIPARDATVVIRKYRTALHALNKHETIGLFISSKD